MTYYLCDLGDRWTTETADSLQAIAYYSIQQDYDGDFDAFVFDSVRYGVLKVITE